MAELKQWSNSEVSVEKRFRCGANEEDSKHGCGEGYGKEDDTVIFSLAPDKDEGVWISFEHTHQQSVGIRERFDSKGRSVKLDDTYGMVSMRVEKDIFLLKRYMGGPFFYTLTKSAGNPYYRVRYNRDSKACSIESWTILSERPLRETHKELFDIDLTRPQRACDADNEQQLFVVLEEAQDLDLDCRTVHTPHMKRTLRLYQKGKRESVATYMPPSPDSQPSDVCFFKLAGQQLLMVADEATDNIHVVRVQPRSLTFVRYLTAGCPLLKKPTALNRDRAERLWVACKGGNIVTITPKPDLISPHGLKLPHYENNMNSGTPS